MFDYFISSVVKYDTTRYLVTITDVRSILGSAQYLIETSDKQDAERKAMELHAKNN